MKLHYTKINCSSIGALMGTARGNLQPTEKEWKDFFNIISKEKEKITERQVFLVKELVTKQVSYNTEKLTETVKQHLAKTYAYEMYGISSLNAGGTKPFSLDKGSLAEDESIKLLSRVDGIDYKKNEKRISNSSFKGIPDILVGNSVKEATHVIDIKTSYDLPSFLSMINEPCDSDDSWQMNGYLDILKLESGEVCHCLVNMPEPMLNAEIARVTERCRQLDIEEIEIEKRILALKTNMVYDHIPERMRVIKYKVYRNDLKMKDAKARVKIARKWMVNLHNNFQNLNFAEQT